MTIFRQSAYNGPAFGVPDPAMEGFTNLVLNGGTAYYQDDGVFGGSCRFTGQAQLEHIRTFPDSTLYWRGYFMAEQNINANRRFMQWTTDNNVLIVSLSVDTDNKWRLRDASNTTTATSVTAFVPGVWYGILYDYNPVTGAQTARFYDVDGVFIEQISGGGTPGEVGRQREGVIQGNNTNAIWLDGTATADQPLTLIEGQVDPEDPEEGDPYRVSPWEGTPGGPLGLEGGDGYYVGNNGAAEYVAPGFAGVGTCARFYGQYAIRTVRDFGDQIYWSGWVRFKEWPSAPRMISVFWESTGDGPYVHCAVGIDEYGKWRLRTAGGSTVATSVRAITPGQWYGVAWHVNRVNSTQSMTIYSYFGSVLEVMVGTISPGPFDLHVEGCIQGQPPWWVDMDQTVLHSVPTLPETELTQVPSNLVFKDGRDPDSPTLQPFYWDGTNFYPVEIMESL